MSKTEANIIERKRFRKWNRTVCCLQRRRHKANKVDDFKEEKGLLNSYYQKHFPFEDICTWLCYGRFEKLCFREFAYTLPSTEFIRRKSFQNLKEMLFEICHVCPVKIDIGGIYNIKPANTNRKKMKIRPIEKELTFDIDLSDYDEIRTCCKGVNMCLKCWKFAAVACKILNASFKEDFGWRHNLWVYSGRRGIHCWVCDPEVRLMSKKQRNRIGEFYNLCKVDRSIYDPVDLGKQELLPARITRSYEIAVQYFVSVCIEEQDILGTSHGLEKFMSLLPSDDYRKRVAELLEQCSTSSERWNSFNDFWTSEEKLRSDRWKLRPHLLKEIVLYYLHPRIDFFVTEGVKHLLKAPFSFHPTTLALCTPFDPEKVDEFVYREVPSVFTFYDPPKDDDCDDCDDVAAARTSILRYHESLCTFREFVKSLGISSQKI